MTRTWFALAAGLAPLALVLIARTPEDFPLGPTGKVLKRELRTRFATLLTSEPDHPADA